MLNYFLQLIGAKNGGKLGYDATEQTHRRRPPRTLTYSEDAELPPHKRRRLIATSRDIARNYPLAAWAVRCHLNYVASYNFQALEDDQRFNARLEELMRWWSRRENCDVTGRHGLRDLVRLAESCRVVDGDILVAFVGEGQLQLIEGDRIVTPSSESDGDIVHGVRLDKYGKPISYAVHTRGSGSELKFERWVSADDAYLLGYFDRADQVRGVSRLASAVNVLRDLYEITQYAVAKAKIAQLFGLVTYRSTSDSLGAISSDPEAARYDIQFGSGPFHLDLDPGDEAKIIESNTPPAELQNFIQLLSMLTLRSLDIPYSFFDEAHTNYSGARQALLQYEYSARQKREQLLCLLDWVTTRKVAQWVSAGLLDMPQGVSHISDIRWEWRPVGMPWIDPLKEINADVAAIKAGLKSRQQIARERGDDFFDIADQLAREQAYIADLGLRLPEE